MATVKLKAHQMFCLTMGGGRSYKLGRLQDLFNAVEGGAKITGWRFDTSQSVDEEAFIDLEVEGEMNEEQRTYIERTNSGTGFLAI